MANRDDVSRELASCTECGAVYAARQWPTGKVQPIGSDRCECGSCTFVIVTDVDDESSSGGASAE